MKLLKIITSLTVTIFFQTVQGQINWTKISEPGVNLIIVNETIGYTYFNSNGSNNWYEYTLKKSNDGFITFNTIRSKGDDYAGCYWLTEMNFLNPDTGFIAEHCNGWAHIYRTMDGGQNWDNTGFWGVLSGTSMCFLSGNFGYYSYDWGVQYQNYSSYLMQSGTQVFATNKYILAKTNPFPGRTIKFINDSTGFIICNDTLDNAVILKTLSFGYDWSEVTVINNTTFNDITFISDSIGFVIGKNGNILKTSDMGESWQQINSNTTINLNSIDFSEDGLGYIVGNEGLILKSQDNGETWSQESFINSNNLIYVRLFSNEYAFINDDEGILYSSANNTSIFEDQADKVIVYPNPVSDKLNINIPSNIQDYTIGLYDLQGKMIIVSIDNEIHTNKLLQGVYILKIDSKQGIYRKMIIKE